MPKKCKINGVLGYFYTPKENERADDNEDIVNDLLHIVKAETIPTQEKSLHEGEFL